ncbi:E3 ubiquitin-protein ligase UPL5 [Acorus calamus]|uniref:HECT-type E3 ubiquitin transferase n=1 Tax=Acorus calamus TaxID=4465 RepID=A0AAV9DYS1_ACOCL|nr:E3 ubiquitin-protein ligase UPL5 [Acorus calamus]
MSTAVATHHRLLTSSKRKLEDLGADDETFIVIGRMRTHDEDEVEEATFSEPSDPPPPPLQIFVRQMSTGSTTVIRASPSDTVGSVIERLHEMTGIPVAEQRLVCNGRQLQTELTLSESGVRDGSDLRLTGRLRSTRCPQSWQVVDDLVLAIFRLIRGERPPRGACSVPACAREFLRIIPEEVDLVATHLCVLRDAGGPRLLVLLYLSQDSSQRTDAETAIKLFLQPPQDPVLRTRFIPIVLEFTRLLRDHAAEGAADRLYRECRASLGTLLEAAVGHGLWCFLDHPKPARVVGEVFPFVAELAGSLSACMSLPAMAIQPAVLREFRAFMSPLKEGIEDWSRDAAPLVRRLQFDAKKPPHEQDWTNSVPAIFMELLEKVRDCLKRMDGEDFKPEWLFFLHLLRELDGISRLHEGGEERLREMLMEQRASMNLLLGRAIRSEEHLWILPFKEVMEGETRRHVVMMMFPEVKEDYEVLHEMLIDRQQLLAESFEYVRQADPEALRSGLFMEFKNEEATGPGVLREWFCLVCRELFNTENALFITYPNDQRRFFPNPGSVVNSLHLDYFRFCGRMIALALMYKVQVGVLFDPLFFVQLGGKVISLEDVRDSDPCFYTSCKQILEMDAALLDSDALGLTFVREIDELGSLREVELCRGGKGITVTSRNRDRYIELLIRHRFVTSISEQTRLFSEGFADILGEQKHLRCFFRSLELKDLDILLNGSEEMISVEDWKGHTEYNGYKETDNQVCWFWKVLESMSADQRRVLLFFWTSVNYLPITGFRGLPSKLYIYKGPESNKRLPSSHTCFFQLGLPAYTSMEIMRERLLVITQEHVSCSFGKW